jgi:hypothetical protein
MSMELAPVQPAVPATTPRSLLDVKRVFTLLWFFAGIGICSLAIPACARALSVGPEGGGARLALETFGTGLFVAGASTLFGSSIGFLFGVPHQARRKGSPDIGAPVSPNTNLEHVSDWLTKVLIGASVTQLDTIVAFYRDLATAVGPAFADSDLGAVIGGALVLHYFVMGLFQGFLIASLWMPGAFARAHHLQP